MAEPQYTDNFIDADAGFYNDKDTYEGVILKQIQVCINVLSREMTSGQVVHKSTSGGTEKYMENTIELVINAVDTLRMTMSFYIKDDFKTEIDEIKEDIENFKKEILEREIVMHGKGMIKLKDMKNIPVDHHSWKEFINYKANKHRDMFEVLVRCFNNSKAQIREMEQE